MFKLSSPDLAKRSATFRYLYYIVSSFRFKSFRSWQQDGEPNPFVTNSYKRVVTERVEFTDIFDDVLKPRRQKSR
ncbi:MAG: hypothetical protein LJE62_09465 [Silicimonas sp.]|jgi:hypothetical protein|nr:hypothetical protein [Silicimonas sp.]